MRPTRTISTALAAVLGAAALAGPATADPHQPPSSWYAGKSTIEGSKHTGQQGAADATKANVYVPPAAAFTDTADDTVKADVYVPPSPQPVHRHVVAVSGSSSGLDWGSAGIGAGAALGASLIALAGATGLRRRRPVQPAATG
jgi:hypothetical protein